MSHKTKLTLRIEVELVDTVKDYAAKHNTTVSRIINEYLRTLAQADAMETETPILRRLTGILLSDRQ